MSSASAVKERASDRIEQELRDLIITLVLSPGTLVSENDLMVRLNCGRTPLREALQRLIQEDLIVLTPRRGMKIAELSLIDYNQIIESVMGVERFAGGLAALRGRQEDFYKLDDINSLAEQTNQRGDILLLTKLDFQFHYLISQMSRNRYLADTTARLHHLTSRFVYAALKNGGKMELSLSEHQNIMTVLKQRDVPLTEQIIREHFYNAKDRMIAAL